MNNREGLSISATFNQLMSIPGFNIFIVLSIILLLLLSGWLSWYIFRKKSRSIIKKTEEKVTTEIHNKENIPPLVKASQPILTKPKLKTTKTELTKPDLAQELKTELAKPDLVQELKTELAKPDLVQELKTEFAKPDLVQELKTEFAKPDLAQELKTELVKPSESKPLLLAALSNTRSGFINKLTSFFSKKNHISAEDLADIEAILFGADIGAHTISKLLDAVRKQIDTAKHIDKALFCNILTAEILNIMHSIPIKPMHDVDKPKVILFVGVNGAGKTTSIGKFAHMLKEEGKSVVLGAGDTFRAAAVAQLQIWAQRIGVQCISGKEGADPASVLFEAAVKAKDIGADYVLCDTAGRLHSKVSLMDELKKTVRVLNKAIQGAPHEIYLVIDATMGQNAMAQAREFSQAISLSGIILSKLDGTAKGGVAIAIVDELKTPIVYVGIGESSSDFKKFDAQDFTAALFKDM